MKQKRRQKLHDLLNGPRFNGDRQAFLSASGLSKGRLTQLLNPNVSFGDAAAKNLCERLGLPDGWFDSLLPIAASKPPHSIGPPCAISEALQAIRAAASQIDDADKIAMAGYVSRLIADPDRVDLIQRTLNILSPPKPLHDTPETGAKRTA